MGGRRNRLLEKSSCWRQQRKEGRIPSIWSWEKREYGKQKGVGGKNTKWKNVEMVGVVRPGMLIRGSKKKEKRKK